MLERLIPINDNATPKEIGAILYDNMSEWGWITSYNYKRKEPKHFSSKELPTDLMKKLNFTRSLYYLGNLYLSEGAGLKLAEKEFPIYNMEKSIICVYCSVLFYLLVHRENKRSGILGNRKMKLVQGFYRHKLRDDIPDMFAPVLGGKNQIGLHAFVTIDDIVFDFTILQQQHAFRLQNPYVIGDIPVGLEYFGYYESITTVDDYWKMFAKEAGVSPESWMLQHELNCLELIKKELDKI